MINSIKRIETRSIGITADPKDIGGASKNKEQLVFSKSAVKTTYKDFSSTATPEIITEKKVELSNKSESNAKFIINLD